MKHFAVIFLVCLLINSQATWSAEIDSDKDGLSDYQERHKYFTEPDIKDSDGDGLLDGDWDERREFTYTIRSVVKVMHPCSPDVICDDYQDLRVLSETKDYVELEVIHYPFNTNDKAIRGKTEWKRQSPELAPYLQPGLSTNFDDEMKEDLLAALQAENLNVLTMTDKQAVENVATWLLKRGKYRYMFGTYFVHFPQSKIEIYPGLEDAFRREKGNTTLPFSEHCQHEVYGKGMFYNKSYGTCTSTAIYLTTGLRAIGVPVRMVLAIPCVDPSDQKQVQMISDHISHNEVRHSLLKAVRGLRGFVAHTFNEVYIGGRWRRLNYRTLGQNIYGEGAMGLLTHIHTFNDLSESGLTKTWGWRYGKGERDEIFKTSNPYRTTEISDRFGIYSKLANPTVEIKEHKVITITKAYWHNSENAPDLVKKSDWARPIGTGRLFIHGDEWFKGEPYTQYKDFMRKADPNFKLVATQVPEVKGSLSLSYITHMSTGVREMEILIPPEEYVKLKRGVEYKLVPFNENKNYNWKVKSDLRITIE